MGNKLNYMFKWKSTCIENISELNNNNNNNNTHYSDIFYIKCFVVAMEDL